MSFQCTIPAVPTVQRDDEDVRITRWDFPPGATTGWHVHHWPYHVVMLTDARMRVHNGREVTQTTLSAGQAYTRPLGVEHDVMNGADSHMAFVEIEMKRPPAFAPLPISPPSPLIPPTQ